MMRAAALVGLLALGGCGAGKRPAPPPAPPASQTDSILAPAMIWEATSTDALEVAKQLDQSVAALRNAHAKFTLSVQDEAGSGNSRGEVMIAGPNQYLVDFYRTTEPTRILRAVADGQRRATLRQDGWSEVEPVPTKWSKSTERVLPLWSRLFPRTMFRPLIEAQPVYEPLVRELRKSGFSVRYEVAEVELNGDYRPAGRILAAPPVAGRHEIEIRLDGIRMVPLTIRMVRNAPAREIIWTASWAFDQKFKPETFKLPSDR